MTARCKSACVHRYDYIGPYVADLANVVDMEAIRSSGVKIGIDPLGGAGVHYWQPIIERYGLAATIVSDAVDPTFRFMTVDWDGKIRMDCSSPYAMARLIGMRDKFDVAFANDTDADRHGIVTRSDGLMNPNHYLAAAIAYLFDTPPAMAQQRAQWARPSSPARSSTGSPKRSAAGWSRPPSVSNGSSTACSDGSFGFAGEESAGASFLRRDGSVWTTDKDGIILGLLAAEITARTKSRSERAVRQADRRTRRAVLRADRRAGDGGAEELAEGAVAGEARDARNSPASRFARR